MKTNYHTHTFFCDGKASAVNYIEEAIGKNFSILGFSAHAPVLFPTSWTLPLSSVKDYHAEIQHLKENYMDHLEIYCGLEADFFPDKMEQTRELYSGYSWDYIIGSIHFIGTYADGTGWCIDGPHDEFLTGWKEIAGNDPLLPIRWYFENTRNMVRTMKPDIIGHMDKIKIQYRPGCMIPETHPYFKEQVMNTLEEIAASDCVVEINTRGMQKGNTNDFYPGKWVIKEMYQMNIPVTISSDAHAAGMLDYGFDQAVATLKETGYRTVRIFKNKQWTDIPLL
ncbi:MAG: histidinol-phosphatase [Bacteroidales bacterium]|jgi:histidinol-phosphatase (PHP family)|nr:histidinol-phosphatase [Bacteroidales bacterium]